MRLTLTISSVLLSLLLVTATASAQDGNATADAPAHSSAFQIAFQGRTNTVSYFFGGVGAIDIDRSLTTPAVTPGVRIIDQRLFLGLGLGFGAYSETQCGMDCNTYQTDSRSYFTLSPTAFFDILRAGPASLYAGGWFSFAPIGSATRETAAPGVGVATVKTDSGTAIGVSLAAGIRAQIVEGLSIGTEWGWNLSSFTFDGDTTGAAEDRTMTVHGIFGTVMIEGAISL